MKEILGILKKNIDTYQMVNDDDPIMITGTEKSASEIEALIKENYYPKEFVKWLGTENTLNEKLNDWICERITSDELYDYWLTNIKDK